MTNESRPAIFETEKQARKYFAKLDDWHDGSEEAELNWEEGPLQCECCQRWTASEAYYGDVGGWRGGWQSTCGVAIFDSLCSECSSEKTTESQAVVNALLSFHIKA